MNQRAMFRNAGISRSAAEPSKRIRIRPFRVPPFMLAPSRPGPSHAASTVGWLIPGGPSRAAIAPITRGVKVARSSAIHFGSSLSMTVATPFATVARGTPNRP